MMRTTLNIPDDVYETVRSVATTKRIPMGQALAELIRTGLKASRSVESKDGFPCFSVEPDAPAITLERTLDAEDAL